MPLTLYKTFACQTFASLRLFTCLVYISTYYVPIAHLRQNKPFPLLYLGHAQITSSSSVKRQTKSSFLQNSKDVRGMAPLVLGSDVFWTVFANAREDLNSRWIWPIEMKEQIVFVFYKRDLGKGYLDFAEFETYCSLEDFSCFLLRRSSWTTCSRTCPSTDSSPLPWQCCTSTRN